MKKLLLIIGLAVSAGSTFAQSDSPVTFGIKGGVNFARLPYSIANVSTTISAGTLTSFQVGAFVDFKLCESVSVQPALLYTGKGSKNAGITTSEGFTYSYTSKTNIYYLQLPVNVLYHVPVGDNSFFVGAGPFLSYGLSGKDVVNGTQEFEGETTTGSLTTDIKFGSDAESVYKRWDYGIGGLAGFKFSNGFLVNLNYDLGLANILPDADAANFKARTRVFSVSVGYAF